MMKYNPRLKALVVSPEDMNQTYFLIMYALKSLRENEELPLTKYKREGSLTSHDFAAIAIVELGMNLGLDFDIKTPHDHNKLDLSKVDT